MSSVERQKVSRGFTLVEMIAVMGIIAILVSSLVFTYNKAKSQARQTDCKSNLRQFGIAVLIYRSDHNNLNPPWLSNLYPDYVDSKQLFICRSDPSHGLGRTRPTGLTADDTAAAQNFPETVDNCSNPGRTAVGSTCSVAANATVGARSGIDACSYFYEFSAAYCDQSWTCVDVDGDGKKSWWEYKEYQLAHGDDASGNQPYSTSRMPIIRCYHHWKEGHIRGYANQQELAAGRITDEKITMNVAYAGNVYVGPLWWEGTIQPGDTNNVAH